MTVLASETEILVMNRKFKELAVLLERLMYFMMLDHNEVDKYRCNAGATFQDEIEEHVRVLVWFWNHLQLSMAAAKFNLVKDHLQDTFKHWHAIGSYNEEFAAADHVKGNREKHSFVALVWKPQLQAESISKHSAMITNQIVRAVTDIISPERRSKRLTTNEREKVEHRRCEVFRSVRYVMDQNDFAASGQIIDYWNLSRDKV